MMANWMQNAVREFMTTTGEPAPDVPSPDAVRTELRARLLMEEAIETVTALGYDFDVWIDGGDWVYSIDLHRVRDPDWPEVIDGLCDIIYIALGTAVELGVSLAPFFWEVHRTNMAKVGGPRRADGKLLKPRGWQPPRIAWLWQRCLAHAGMNRANGCE